MQVVNKRTHRPTLKDVYIGRSGPNPSPLANPYSHNPNSRAREITKTREEAIAKYRIWLNQMIETNDQFVVSALDSIPDDANLVCHCAPLSCHGNVIKEVLEARRNAGHCTHPQRGFYNETDNVQYCKGCFTHFLYTNP